MAITKYNIYYNSDFVHSIVPTFLLSDQQMITKECSSINTNIKYNLSMQLYNDYKHVTNSSFHRYIKFYYPYNTTAWRIVKKSDELSLNSFRLDTILRVSITK